MEKEGQTYHIEIIGHDKSNTEVKVYYEGKLKTDSRSMDGIDPNFALPQLEDI